MFKTYFWISSIKHDQGAFTWCNLFSERRAQFEEFVPEQDKDANCKKAYRFIQQHCDTKPKIPIS